MASCFNNTVQRIELATPEQEWFCNILATSFAQREIDHSKINSTGMNTHSYFLEFSWIYKNDYQLKEIDIVYLQVLGVKMLKLSSKHKRGFEKMKRFTGQEDSWKHIINNSL